MDGNKLIIGTIWQAKLLDESPVVSTPKYVNAGSGEDVSGPTILAQALETVLLLTEPLNEPPRNRAALHEPKKLGNSFGAAIGG